MHTIPQEDALFPEEMEERGGHACEGGSVQLELFWRQGGEAGSSWCAESRGSGWLVKSFSLLSSICQGLGL